MAKYGEFPCGDSMVPLDTSGDYLLAQRIAKMRYDVFKLTTEDILSEARSKARSDDAYKSALRRANRVKAALGVRGASRSSASRSSSAVHKRSQAELERAWRAQQGYQHKMVAGPSTEDYVRYTLDHSGR